MVQFAAMTSLTALTATDTRVHPTNHMHLWGGMMSDLEDALGRLLTVRADLGAKPMGPVSPRKEVIAALEPVGMAECEEAVTWHSMLGGGLLVYGNFVEPVDESVSAHEELVAIAEDFADQPEAVSRCVDWYQLSFIGRAGLVMWARPTEGDRPLAFRSEVADFAYPPYTGGLASVVHTWADRFASGRYVVREDGAAWFADKFFDDPDELMAVYGL